MTEPTARCAARCPNPSVYCGNCDLLVGLDGLHVLEVGRTDECLRVRVESLPGLMGCPACGVVALSHGRREVELIDAPCFGRPVMVVWWKRTWSCPEPTCPVSVFTEQDDEIARPRALLTTRAAWWAVRQLRREHASVLGLARQLGTSWKTVWRSVKPLLEVMDGDPSRFDGVQILGVDEHFWHHVSPLKRGPKELTGMVKLTRDEKGNTRAKTPLSRRTLPLPQVVADALAEHMAHFPPALDGTIFTTRTSQPYRHDYYGSLIFKAAVRKAELPTSVTTHALRHHYASLLLAAGESVVAVAERLGHENANLVLSTYGYVMPNSEDKTRKAVDEAWNQEPHGLETASRRS